jgi:hypothetical protein
MSESKVVEFPQHTTVLGPAVFCAYCNHHREWHTQTGPNGKEIPRDCIGTQTPKCHCVKFCPEFEPDPNSKSGLYCKHCMTSVFHHQRVVIKLTTRLTNSEHGKVAISLPTDIIYKVRSSFMKVCCLWSIYHVMRTYPDVKQIKPGFRIDCPNCVGAGRLAVVQSEFLLGPTWEWEHLGKKV